MGRKFTDKDGRAWSVERPHGRRELVFRPIDGPESDERTVAAPTHTADPFELSDAELQRLFDRSSPRYRRPEGPPPF